MPSPFPGMDPYLENPEIFPDLHDSLITYLRENLQASLPPPYYAAIGRRVWIEASRRSIEPDVHVLRAGAARQAPSPTSGPRRLPVAARQDPSSSRSCTTSSANLSGDLCGHRGGSKRLVTSIEVLSLSNKTPGETGARALPTQAEGTAGEPGEPRRDRPASGWQPFDGGSTRAGSGRMRTVRLSRLGPSLRRRRNVLRLPDAPQGTTGDDSRSPSYPAMRRCCSISRPCSTAAMTRDRTLVRSITANPRSSRL